MKTIIALIAALALTGCATGQADYYKAETARHQAEAAKWSAMSKIAETGGEAVKATAVTMMGMPFGGSGQVTAPPKSPVDTALQVAGLIVPAVVQGYQINANMRTSMRLSDNSVSLANSTNSAFVGIASRIQAPVANVSNVTNTTASAPVIPQANVTTTTTTNNANQANVTTSLGGSGVIGNGSYNASPVNTTTTTTTNAAPTPVAR